MSVEIASWVGLVPEDAGSRYRPTNDPNNLPEEFDYVEEEWFVGGEQNYGAYATVVLVRRPRDPARFSGTILVEPLRIQGNIVAMSVYGAPYIMRSGHGWAMIVSQKLSLDVDVKPVNPRRYASLEIATEPESPGAALLDQPLPQPPWGPEHIPYFAEAMRYRPSSSEILAQVGAALRSSDGPFGGCSVEHVLLMGYSQTGNVVSEYVLNDHDAHRFPDGSPVFDGYFPGGAPAERLSARDVPIVQLLAEGDLQIDGIGGLPKGAYRREDSDEPDDRYRLYELAGHAHVGTRYPPFNDPDIWRLNGVEMSSLPTFELFQVALHHLVQWVTSAVTPPRAERLQLGDDGLPVRDELGHALGGLRCAPLDVPRARYTIDGLVALQEALDEVARQRLHGDEAAYLAKFDARLAALIAEGFFLAATAPGLPDDVPKDPAPE